MPKRIVRFHEAYGTTDRKGLPCCFFQLDSGGIEGGRSSQIQNVSFDENGEIIRFETNNSIYVQVKE